MKFSAKKAAIFTFFILLCCLTGFILFLRGSGIVVFPYYLLKGEVPRPWPWTGHPLVSLIIVFPGLLLSITGNILRRREQSKTLRAALMWGMIYSFWICGGTIVLSVLHSSNAHAKAIASINFWQEFVQSVETNTNSSKYLATRNELFRIENGKAVYWNDIDITNDIIKAEPDFPATLEYYLTDKYSRQTEKVVFQTTCIGYVFLNLDERKIVSIKCY